MSSLQQLQQQRATFIAAYAAHTITQSQRDVALAANQKQIDALNAKQNPPQQTKSPSSSSSISAMPADPTQNIINQGGTTWQNTQTSSKLPTVIPTNMGPVPMSTFMAGHNDPTMQNVVIPALETTAVVGGAIVAPEIVIPGVVAGEVSNIGVSSAVKSFQTGQAQLVLPTSVREITDTAALSAGLSLAGAGALGAIGKVAPSLIGEAANPIVATATRTGVNAGLGAGVNAVASGGNPQSIAEGAAFGAGLGLIGEAVGKIGGKISDTSIGQKVITNVNNLRDTVIGAKFTELTGAKELEVQTTQGKETIIDRLTEPTTKTVTLKGHDAQFYRENNLGSLKNPVIDLAGSERVYTGGKEVDVIPTLRQTETSRSATPILEAVKGNTVYKMGSVRTGNVGNFLETPSDMPALKSTKTWIQTDKGQPNAIRSENSIVTPKEAILPDTKISFRDYTGAKIRGSSDSQIYAAPAKALPTDISQDIYKKLGGNYRPIVDYGSQAPKDLSGSMKTGSNDFFRNTGTKAAKDSSTEGVKKPITGTVQKPISGNKDLTLPRPIVGEVNKTPSSIRYALPAGALGGLNINTKTTTYEDTTHINYPNSGLATPPIISQPSLGNTRMPQPIIGGIQDISPIVNPIGGTVSKIDTSPIRKIGGDTTPLPIISPITGSGTGSGSNPIIGGGQDTTPIIGPIIGGPTKTDITTPTIFINPTPQPPNQTTYPINFFEPPKPKLSSPVSIFPLGGGTQFGRRNRGGGAFYERKNPIVTPKLLTGRFLGGSSSRRSTRPAKRRTTKRRSGFRIF